MLASALRGRREPWPRGWAGFDSGQLSVATAERIEYHGIASLLAEDCAQLEGWPELVTTALRQQALARSMWELRHRAVVSALLRDCAEAGFQTLFLKGTAIAYDLYRHPAARERGDSDLLVDSPDRHAVRRIFAGHGFARHESGDRIPDDLSLQESWTLVAQDGTEHVIDLHWQVLNAPAMVGSLTLAAMAHAKRPLARLATDAFAPARPMVLLHACLHLKTHDCVPYFVGGRTYYGGGRLIWLYDIALLAAALTEVEWQDFCLTAIAERVADTCMAGLGAAERTLGAKVPVEVIRRLIAAAPSSRSYFRSGQMRRALLDLFAIRGARARWHYFKARMFPGPGFMRAKYPHLADRSLPVLYSRRLLDLVAPRSGGGTS